MLSEVTKFSRVADVTSTIAKPPMLGQKLGPEIPDAYEMSVKSKSTTGEPAQVDSNSEQPADMKKVARVQIAAFTSLSWVMFMQGWNDGTNGPLLPAIQRHYHVCRQQGHTHPNQSQGDND